jgi:hypothetical protein
MKKVSCEKCAVSQWTALPETTRAERKAHAWVTQSPLNVNRNSSNDGSTHLLGHVLDRVISHEARPAGTIEKTVNRKVVSSKSLNPGAKSPPC